MMKRTIAVCLLILNSFAVTAAPAPAQRSCSRFSGEKYVICKETGDNPKYERYGVEHPGPSSASGPYGLLDMTRERFSRRCGYWEDRCIATAYAESRYGSWEAAAAAHRSKGWW